MLIALVTCLVSIEAADLPRVELVETRGVVDGPAVGASGSPRWDRVALELTLVNRLDREVGDFRFEVELVRTLPVPTAIPGWSFVVERPELWLPAKGRHTVRLEHALPERREPLAAPEINFRVRLVRYRIEQPDLSTAVRLLGSASKSDQRAALVSYEADRLTQSERDRAVRRLAAALDRLPRAPSASDALRLLFALRALGRLGASGQVPRLLTLPNGLDEAIWGQAVVDLAQRILQVQQPDEPRLEVLPSWAQKTSALLEMKAQDAVREAVRDAILRMGDAAVPGLVRVVHGERDPELRERAWRLLVALGRPTVRSQLRLSERGPQLEAIRAAGDLRLRDAASALVELLDQKSALVRQAAANALVELGRSALPALETRLGREGDEVAAQLVSRISRRPGGELHGASRARADARVEAIRTERRAAHEAAVQAQIERALAAGREGRSAEALRRLEALREDDPRLFVRHAPRIVEIYARHAEQQLAARNYDAAWSAARDGLSVRWSPDLAALAQRAREALVRGYIRLGEWTRAGELLEGRERDATSRELAIQVTAGRVRAALADGNRGLARALLNRARLEAPDHPTLRALHRRMLWLENLPTTLAVALGGGGALIALGVLIRRRFETVRMERLEEALDRR